MINKILNLKNYYTFLLLFTLFLGSCMPKLEEEMMISSKGKNYLVNIKINKIENNSYYGDMYFANLSDKDIEFMLLEDLFSKEKYKISVKDKRENIYPVYIDSSASIGITLLKNEIKTYKIKIQNTPQDFMLNEAILVISNSIFFDK